MMQAEFSALDVRKKRILISVAILAVAAPILTLGSMATSPIEGQLAVHDGQGGLEDGYTMKPGFTEPVLRTPAERDAYNKMVEESSKNIHEIILKAADLPAPVPKLYCNFKTGNVVETIRVMSSEYVEIKSRDECRFSERKLFCNPVIARTQYFYTNPGSPWVLHDGGPCPNKEQIKKQKELANRKKHRYCNEQTGRVVESYGEAPDGYVEIALDATCKKKTVKSNSNGKTTNANNSKPETGVNKVTNQSNQAKNVTNSATTTNKSNSPASPNKSNSKATTSNTKISAPKPVASKPKTVKTPPRIITPMKRSLTRGVVSRQTMLSR